MKALIGYTGYIGSNIAQAMDFDYYYNTANIHEINNRSFDLVVAAGLSGNKWITNLHPALDMVNCVKYADMLVNLKCNTLVLSSTIDVYEKTYDNTKLEQCSISHHHYGWNRNYVEKTVSKYFKGNLFIMRFPRPVGTGLKKGILFDLLNNKFYNKLNLCDLYQWYDLKWIGHDIRRILQGKDKEVNLFSHPIQLSTIMDLFLKFDKRNMYKDYNNRIIYDLPVSINNHGYWTDYADTLLYIGKFIKKYYEKN